MTWLDDELQSLLKRQAPPPGFTGQVLARIQAMPRRSFIHRTAGLVRRPMVRWVAVGVACLALATGLVQYRREQQRREQAEQARQQAILALRIASAKLNTALEQAQRITVQALGTPENLKTRME